MYRIGLFICLFLSTLSIASPAVERLKQRYQAIDSGTETLPEITDPSPLNSVLVEDANLVRIPTGEELILSIMFRNQSLGDVFGIKTDQGAQISLSDFTRALDFPVDVELDEPSAKGWARSPDSAFSLTYDALSNVWNVDSDYLSAEVPAGAVLLEDDLYVDVDQLQSWFDITLDVNYQNLSINVVPLTPIPLEGKLDRQSRFDHLHIFSNEPRFPLQEYGYSPLTSPVLDIQFLAANSQATPSSHSLSVLGSNDLAYFNTQYYFATNTDDELVDTRFTAARYSPDGTLLGPMSATEFQLGDVRASNISPLSQAPVSRGIRVSNNTLGYQGGNSVDLTGDIQAGWDVEVYRNQLLVASDINVRGGNYYFQNVPLIFGTNEIEVVFYGPQGQIERDFRSYYVSSTSTSAGEFHYDISAVDEGNRLFNEYSQASDQQRDTTLNVRSSYAFTDWLNIYAGAKRYENSDYAEYDETSYGSEIALFGKALLTIDLLEQQNEQFRHQYQMDSQWRGQSISLINRDYRTYNEDNNSWRDYKSQEARLTGLIRSLSLSYQQTLEYVQDNQTTYYRVTNQLGTHVGRSYLSNRIIWLSNNDQLTTGEWQLQRYINGFFWRVGNRYTAHPEMELDSVYTELSGDLTENMSSRLSYTRDLDNANNITAVSLSWRPNEFSLTSRLGYNDNGGWTASLLGQISIGRAADTTFASNQTLVNQGSVAVFVYHDQNNNGIFDGSDTPLSDVEVRSEPSFKQAKTNASGVAILPSLTAFRQTDIDVEDATLPDPYMIRRNAGISVKPSPGVVQQIEIPIVVSLEIEGSILEIDRNNNSKPLAYVPIEVINTEGEIVKEILSEYDGYYLASSLPPGDYTLRIQQSYLAQNEWLTPQALQVNHNDQDVISGQDILLRKAFNQSGYSAELGQFASIDTLNSYWAILTMKHPELRQYEHFYAFSNGQYTLYSAFSDNARPAQEVCSAIGQTQCSIKRIRRR